MVCALRKILVNNTHHHKTHQYLWYSSTPQHSHEIIDRTKKITVAVLQPSFVRESMCVLLCGPTF